MSSKEPRYLPTPEEIRVACLRIQRTWPDDEWKRRITKTTELWHLPEVHVGEVQFDTEERS